MVAASETPMTSTLSAGSVTRIFSAQRLEEIPSHGPAPIFPELRVGQLERQRGLIGVSPLTKDATPEGDVADTTVVRYVETLPVELFTVGQMAEVSKIDHDVILVIVVEAQPPKAAAIHVAVFDLISRGIGIVLGEHLLAEEDRR
jgi:hypothetical protein